jgi:hypothetical protein
MMGKYKTFGSRFDRVHRNDLNANFAAVEADINVQKGRVDDLITGNPQPSEVVDSRGGFPVLGERLNDLSSSLAQNMTNQQQVDFVKLLQEHNQVAPTLYVKKTADRKMEVLHPIAGKKCALYSFNKNQYDDYIILGKGHIVNTQMTPIEKTGEDKNYDSDTGTWTKSNVNYYTTEIGATFTFTFEGTGFDMRHYADNTGGIWEFVVDGDTANKITYSTYSATVVNVKRSVIARGLTKKTHTVVATYTGFDPLNGGGLSRGWIRYDTVTKGIILFDDYLNYTKLFDVTAETSNRDFAMRVTPYGSGYTAQWFPEHNSLGTVFATSQEIYFDDNKVTDWTADRGFNEVKVVKIIQKMIAKHPDDTANPLCEIYSLQTVSAKGVSIKVKFKWLVKSIITDGYVMMFPYATSFGNQLITSYGKRYDSIRTDGGFTDLTEGDKTISFAAINNTATDGKQNIVAAMTIQDIKNTFRQNGIEKRSPLLWLEHRIPALGLQKLYPHVFRLTNMNVGETNEIGGTFFIGELPMASELL